MKYFKDIIEYPREVPYDILPWNIMWAYISQTFLNGFINYVEIIKAFVIGRYDDWETQLESSHTISVAKPPGSFEWTKVKCNTKDELYKELIIDEAVYHSKFHDFQDDVMILAKIDAATTDWENPYMFFWFDCDVSDCCIGRFKTRDKETDVIAEFIRYIKELDYNEIREREIPLHYFKGWLSW